MEGNDFGRRWRINGIIISGGNDINKNSLRYKVEKRLTDISKKKKIPLLGICHGLQFINYVEGGSLKKINNHVRVYHKIKCNFDYPLKVNSFHEYGVNKLGRNFEIIAYSEDNQIEAIKHKKYNSANKSFRTRQTEPNREVGNKPRQGSFMGAPL